MILVSICGQEVLRLLVDDGQHVLLPVLEVAVVVADEEEDVLLRLERHLAQIGLDVLGPAMEPGERVAARLGGLDRALALLLGRELADRQVAPAVHRERVGGVEQRLDPLDADRGILLVVAHAVGARLELRRASARRGSPWKVKLFLKKSLWP